jgi:hypothetical protein
MTQETRPASAAAQIGRTVASQASKTTMRKLALASVCALAALTVAAGNANATPLTQYAWTSTFVDNGPGPGWNGNHIAFTGTFSNANGQYNLTGSTTSQPNPITDFLTLCETNNSYGTGKESISVGFTFSSPGLGGGTIGGQVQVSNSWSLTWDGLVDTTTGKITWTNNNPLDITFLDGAEISIQLANVTGWDISSYNGCSGNCATVGATFTVLKDPTAVPEPASIALLGVGMIGTGVMARRRRSSSPFLAA